MEKIKITIELSVEEHDALIKACEQSKKLGFIPIHMGINDFVYQLLMSYIKMPQIDFSKTGNITEQLEKVKELFGDMDLNNFMNDFMNKTKPEKKTEKKEEGENDAEEYKS